MSQSPSAAYLANLKTSPQGLSASWFFQNSLDLFLVHDWEGRALEANPAWDRTVGRTVADLARVRLFSLVHPDDRESLVSSSEELLATGAARRVFRLKAADGGWVWINGITQKIGDDRLMTVMRDVTEERQRAFEIARMRLHSRLLADEVGVVTWTIDPVTNTFTRSHPRAKDDEGDERITMPMEQLDLVTHPDDRQAVVDILNRGLTLGTAGSYESRVVSMNGWRSIRVHFTCEPLAQGGYALHGLSQDITELVAARDAARAAEAEMRAMLEDAPFASVLLDSSLKYVTANTSWRTMFNLPADRQFDDRSFASLAAPELRKRIARLLKRALKGEVVNRSEERITRSDGVEMIVRWQARPWLASNGDVRGVILYANDITDMVLQRRAARANVKRLKLALDSANATVFEVDYAQKTFWAAPGFHKLAGRALTFKEALGVWPTVHPEDKAHVAAHVDTFDTHNPKPIDARLMTPAGPLWTRAYMRITHDSAGRPSKSTGLILDIDASKRQKIALAEAERRANVATEAKSQFLANISHEIRTPMNGVLGVLQLIKRDHLDPEELGLLDEALASGRMLTEMLDDLLDYSKIETGQFELNAEPLDPSAVLMGVAALLQPVASAKGLTMNAVAAPDLGLISADPLRLRQALYNLMGNAVKFTPSGSIEARLMRVDGGKLRFEIQDTGIGVVESAQATLFERFEQADGTASRQYGGTGLGLAITKRLAEMMGGSVGFSSRPGEGSTFWIEIDGTSVEATANDIEAADIGAFRVLLVEDNPTNRLVICKILEALGVVVETACDGAEGVEKAAAGSYDLVLMDIQMPGMDGIEATKRIRAMEGPTGATPILAVTANVMAEQRVSYEDAGMNGVVSKPVSAAALLSEIARVTERAA